MKSTIQTGWDLMKSGFSTFVLIGFGLVLRIITLIFFVRLPLVSDALAYHFMALQLLSGEDFSPLLPPALPYFISFFFHLFGTSEFVTRASMLLFYPALSIAIFLLTKEISTIRAGNLTILFFSIFPTFIFHSVEPLTQLPTAAFLAATGYLVILIEKKFHWLYLILLGITLALLVLMRTSNILIAVLIPFYLFVKTKNPGRFLIPLFIAIAIVSLWIVKVNQMTGRWMAVNELTSANFFIGNNPYTPLYKTWWLGSHHTNWDPEVPVAYRELLSGIESNPPEMQDALFIRVALEHILSRPDLFFIRTTNRIRNYFAFDTFTGSALIRDYLVNKLWGLVVLFLDAFFYCVIMMVAIRSFFDSYLASSQMQDVTLLLFLAACYAVPYWISFSHPTYHFPVVPLFGILAMIFVEKWLESRQKGISMPLLPLGGGKSAFILAGLIFFYIQIEWVLVMWSRI
jgi:4-amino-4-deoxy-L-arabinose transferase-like glycosyltransferase